MCKALGEEDEYAPVTQNINFGLANCLSGLFPFFFFFFEKGSTMAGLRELPGVDISPVIKRKDPAKEHICPICLTLKTDSIHVQRVRMAGFIYQHISTIA